MIFDNPSINVCVNRQWIPYITGVLEPLTLSDYWPIGSSALADYVERLIARLNENVYTGDCTEDGALDIEVTWSHVFDFTIDEQGWTGYSESWAGGPAAVYDAGVGWTIKTATGYNYSTIEIQSPSVSSFELLTVSVNYYISPTVPEIFICTLNTNTNTIGSLPFAADENFASTVAGDFPGTTQVMLFMNRSFAPFQTGAHINRVVLTGRGTDPF